MLKGAKRPLIILGKGAAYAQCDELVRRFVETSGIPYIAMSMAKGLLPDDHPQYAGAARSLVLKDADCVMLVGARLNWLLGHGKGKQWGAPGSKKFIHIDIDPREMDSNQPIAAPLVGDIESCLELLLDRMGDWQKPSDEWTGAIRAKVDENVGKMAPRLQNNAVPMDFHGALGRLKRIFADNPDAILVNEGANTLDFARSIIDMSKPRKRLDVGTWGVMGIGMGTAIAAAVETGQPVVAIEGDFGLRLQRHGGRDDLPLRAAGLRRDLQQLGHLSRHRHRPDGARPGHDGLRAGRQVPADDGGLRRRRRRGPLARRPRARRARGHRVAQADAGQRHHRPRRRHRERPDRQPEPAEQGEEEGRRQQAWPIRC